VHKYADSISNGRGILLAMKQYALLVVLAVVGISMTPSVYAAATEPAKGLDFTYEGTPFGGMIDQVIICTCTMNYLLKIRDAASKGPKSILYTPGISRLYAHYLVGERRWILGTYSPSLPCMILIGIMCLPLQTDGEINKGPGAGTSKLPNGAAF